MVENNEGDPQVEPVTEGEHGQKRLVKEITIFCLLSSVTSYVFICRHRHSSDFVCLFSWVAAGAVGVWRGGWAGHPSHWDRVALHHQERTQEKTQLWGQEIEKHGEIQIAYITRS